MKLEPMTDDNIESVARDAVDQAIDFIESEIADDRIKAQRYFDGEVDIGEEEGRSKVVATKVRDTIRQIKPSLMRIFLSNENFVEYIPRNPQDVMAAETATKYVHAKFNENNGYKVISDAFHDALLKKVGVVKCYWDEYEESEIHEFSNLTEEELAFLAADDDVVRPGSKLHSDMAVVHNRVRRLSRIAVVASDQRSRAVVNSDPHVDARGIITSDQNRIASAGAGKRKCIGVGKSFADARFVLCHTTSR